MCLDVVPILATQAHTMGGGARVVGGQQCIILSLLFLKHDNCMYDFVNLVLG